MKQYDSYKPSGIPWIDQIPSHWETLKIKYCFVERSQKGFPDEPMLCATQSQGVIPQSKYANRVVVVNKDFDKQKLVKIGDFVISLRSFEGGIEYAYYQGIISAAYTILKPKNAENTDYFKYLFKSFHFIQLLRNCVTGIREGQNINYPLLSKNSIPIPPLEEQKRIVEYLSIKTSQIDAQQRERERELRLLEELKQAEIANVVTHGLNPDVPMKDSGIPWIGQIPSHWNVRKIRSLYAQRSEKVSDKEFEPLSVSKRGVTPQLEDAVKTDNGDNRKLVRKGDFVVNSRSDRKGSCGVSKIDGSVSLINIVVYPITKLNSQYYHLLFRSNNYIEEFYRLGRGIVADLWTTKFDDMRNIYVPYPPLEEQRAIVEYIEKKNKAIDDMIANLRAEIDFLTEYKQRLIADAVTGQIKID